MDEDDLFGVGKWTSTRSLTQCTQSMRVRRALTLTYRQPRSGYRVIFVPFAGAQPSGMPVEVLTGFMVDGKAYGRPVGVQVARDGSLLVADDVGGKVWRVSLKG